MFKTENQFFISIIIPTYNEEHRLPKILFACDKYLNSQEFKDILKLNGYQVEDYEIIISDDGSKDKTIQTAESFKTHLKNIKIIDNKINHGKGYVVRKGILEAKGKYRIFTDADNSTSIDQLEKLIPYLKGFKSNSQIIERISKKFNYKFTDKLGFYDIAIGSRAITGAEIVQHQPFYKEFLGRFGNILIRIVAVPNIYDTQCGFKIFTAKAAEEIFSKTMINKWGFDIEVLALAKQLGFSIKEVPVKWENDPFSKVKLSGYIKTFLELLKIKYNLVTNKYKLNN